MANLLSGILQKGLGTANAVVKAGTGLDFTDSLGKQFKNLADAATTADYIKDFKHAQRMFGDNNFALAPKHGAMFHVNIEFNPIVNPFDNLEQIELGMLAKNVTLPSFNYDTEQLVAYNRKVNIQTKINYGDITIEFHDDTSNVTKRFHELYLGYHFKDGIHENPTYDPSRSTYGNRTTDQWGYSGTFGNFIARINVYSMSQKQFTHYVIENPLIKSFQHGRHDYAGENFMSSIMVVAPEAIRYIGEGIVTSDQVRGFGVEHYDRTPSPLQTLGGRDTIIGKGGLTQTIGGIGDKIASGNFLGAAADAFRGVGTFKNANLKKTALRDITGLATDVLRGNNTQGKYFFPSISNIVDKFGSGAAGNVPKSPQNSGIAEGSPASRVEAGNNTFAQREAARKNAVIGINLGQNNTNAGSR